MKNKFKLTSNGPIIMVDDSESDTFLARKCYERSSLSNEFVVVHSANALLEYLAAVRDGAKQMPALVLLDINMPGKSGFEALVEIRDVPEFKTIPIITMLTNSDDPRDVQKSSTLGADGFYTKPSDINDYIGFFDSLASGEAD